MSAAADSQPSSNARPSRLSVALSRLDEAMENGRIPALLIAIVTGLVLFAFLFTDDFRVETVIVEGVSYGDGHAVVEQSGLLDISAFRANPEVAVARISSLPYVETVSVEVQFPGQAIIRIQERKPALNVEHVGLTSLVSSQGLVISSTVVEGLPVLRVDGRGADIETDLTPAVVSAVEAIANIYGPDANLIWDSEIGLAMEMSRDRLVIFGDPDGIDAKLRVLSAIDAQVDSDWYQLDIRVPTRPSYR